MLDVVQIITYFAVIASANIAQAFYMKSRSYMSELILCESSWLQIMYELSGFGDIVLVTMIIIGFFVYNWWIPIFAIPIGIVANKAVHQFVYRRLIGSFEISIFAFIIQIITIAIWIKFSFMS